MSSCVTYDTFPCVAGTMEFPASNGLFAVGALVTASKQSLPTDPIGATTVTFSGVPAGSEIRVYDPDRNELAGIESCAADQVLTWSVYAAGSPNNTVRIVIIDMAHRIKEFTYTSQVGAQSIPVQSENDKWYSNPA